MSRFGNLAKLLHVACLAAAAALLPQVVDAGPRYKVLERFDGAKGRQPSGPLVADEGGNLYGVTWRDQPAKLQEHRGPRLRCHLSDRGRWHLQRVLCLSGRKRRVCA